MVIKSRAGFLGDFIYDFIMKEKALHKFILHRAACSKCSFNLYNKLCLGTACLLQVEEGASISLGSCTATSFKSLAL